MKKEAITERIGNVVVNGLWGILRAKEKTEELIDKTSENVSNVKLPEYSRREVFKLGLKVAAGTAVGVVIASAGYITFKEINERYGPKMLKEGEQFSIDNLTFYNYCQDFEIGINEEKLREVTEKEAIPLPDFTTAIVVTDNKKRDTQAKQTIFFNISNVGIMVKQNPPDKDIRIRRAEIDISIFILSHFLMYADPKYKDKFSAANLIEFPEDMNNERKRLYDKMIGKFLPKKKENPGSRLGYDLLPSEYSSFISLRPKN